MRVQKSASHTTVKRKFAACEDIFDRDHNQQRWFGSILRLCFFQKRTEKLGKSPTHSPAFRRIIGIGMRNVRPKPEKEDSNNEDKNI